MKGGNARTSSCMNCGADLGYYESDPYRSCGAQECDREARYARACALDERMERAREDDYERY
jgi:hypothetical protein